MLCLVGGCATSPLSGARYWQIDGCTSRPTDNVRFNRADGTQIAIVPRRTCEAINSAALKIQSASGFYLSRVLIADPDDPNAFATRDKNGNPIAIVTLGMMTSLGSDEDAWAGLLGHEIAHLVRRHSDSRADAQASARGAGEVIANVVSMAVPGVGGFIGGTVAGTATQMAVYGSYTRPQEAEADELGLQWMVAAGYDPRGLLRLFDVLRRRASMPAFLSTHPAAQDRTQAVEAFIAGIPQSRKSGSTKERGTQVVSAASVSEGVRSTPTTKPVPRDAPTPPAVNIQQAATDPPSVQQQSRGDVTAATVVPSMSIDRSVRKVTGALKVAAASDGSFGYVDSQGNWAIPPAFSEAREFSPNALAAARESRGPSARWGYINTSGTWIIAPTFTEATPFDSFGWAAVAVGNAPEKKWGFINSRGEWEVLPIFDFAYPFGLDDANVTKVRLGSESFGIWKHLNRSGVLSEIR